jgi:putative hemolysin
MMKYINIVTPFALVLGAACSPENTQTNIANPAATFCVEQGGSYTPATADTAATCTLADGRIVDAWDYFRENASAAG